MGTDPLAITGRKGAESLAIGADLTGATGVVAGKVVAAGVTGVNLGVKSILEPTSGVPKTSVGHAELGSKHAAARKRQ